MTKKTWIAGLAIIAASLILYTAAGMGAQPTRINWGDALKKIQNGEISTIQTNSNNHNVIIVSKTDANTRFSTIYPAGRAKLDEILENSGVNLDNFPQIDN